MTQHLDVQANGKLDSSANLWRYMKLTTLLYMLTEKRVFIPKLSTLQRGDKFEGWLDLQNGQQDKNDRDLALKDDEEWFRREKGGTTEGWEKSAPPELSALWLRELTRRRCVWCWHQSEDESMAQWVIYGREAGVAIRSDTKSVLQTFESADVVYGEVQYVHPGQLPREVSTHLPWHPYFLKHGSFRHEQEVRFVLADDPDWPDGRVVKVAPEILIKEVVISPLLLPSEATAVLKAVKQLGEKHKIESVRISGGQDVNSPLGRTGSTIEKRAFELAAEDWLKNGPRNHGGEPRALKLISSTT
jgi:hypothetical protein